MSTEQPIPGSIDPPAAGSAEALLDEIRSMWAPPPRLTVSEFADAELVVPTGPQAGTKWRTDFAPYQRGILDAFSEPGVEHVVVMGSSQWGKTSIALNLVAYHVVHDPCPILVVEPTRDPMAKDFSKNRLDPLIAATPALQERFSKKRARDSSNTTYLKTFQGGLLAIAGANSAASLASRSIRLLVLDEIDRYPPQLRGEGNTIQIALKRTVTYGTRRRVLMLSSPTMVHAPIDAWFQRGDQRRYHVPCVACGAMHAYEWANVRWEDDDPSSARIYCPECGYGMDDAERIAVLDDGEWRAGVDGERGLVSFHMWEAYSPFSKLQEMAAGFVRARAQQKAGDASEMHTWQNTTLGQPVQHDTGEGVEPIALMLRRESYAAPAPEGVACITMGVDTQDDRLEALVVGWGPGEESWIIDRQLLPGDTSQPEPWAMLDRLLSHEYKHASGQRIPIQATCIDSAGHRTKEVYEYCRRNGARRVYATIGRAGDRVIVSSPSRPQRGRGGRKVPLYTIGVDAAKATLVSRMALTERGPGYIHIPHEDWADEELCAQLTSERLVTRWHHGVPKTQWRNFRPRNEMLDCAVLALAALRLLNPDLELLAERLVNPEASTKPVSKEPQRQPWIRPRGRAWFDRR